MSGNVLIEEKRHSHLQLPYRNKNKKLIQRIQIVLVRASIINMGRTTGRTKPRADEARADPTHQHSQGVETPSTPWYSTVLYCTVGGFEIRTVTNVSPPVPPHYEYSTGRDLP